MARGQRLGEAKDATFDETTVSWADGDRLVLYTDGIVEWPGPKGKAYGDRRFRKALEANCKKSAAEIVDALHDDLTLVAVELRA